MIEGATVGRDTALEDIFAGARWHEMWRAYAMHDLEQRFKRSVLGPLWITLSMGIMVIAMGVIFSTLFHQQISKTLPYIALGLIFWNFLTACINEGAVAFVSAESLIKSVPLPLSVHFYQAIWRNILSACFNIIIFIGLAVYFDLHVGLYALLVIPGLALFMLNISWIALVAAIVSARFRDIPPIISSALQVIFWMTPIFWMPNVELNRLAFIERNPFYLLLQIVRGPLLGEYVPWTSWVACAVMGVAGTVLALLVYQRSLPALRLWI